MKSWEHLLAMSRIMTLGLASVGTEVDWDSMEIMYKLNGGNYVTTNSNYKLTSEGRQIILPTMTSDELSNPDNEADPYRQMMMKKAVDIAPEFMSKQIGYKRKNKGSILEDEVYYELIEAIRTAPEKQSTKAMEAIMRKFQMNSTLTKSMALSSTLTREEMTGIDQIIGAVAINNAKIMATMPKPYIDSRVLGEIFDDNIYMAMDNESARNTFFEQSVNSSSDEGSIVFSDERLLGAYNQLNKDLSLGATLEKRYYDDNGYDVISEKIDLDSLDDDGKDDEGM